MPKFVRIDSSNTDNIIKFLGNFTKKHQYDTIYQFLFNILDDKLINEKNLLNNNKNDCDKKIKLLESDKNIASLDALKQKDAIISDELNKLFEERKKLDYIKTYKSELDKKRNLTNEISDCLLAFSINLKFSSSSCFRYSDSAFSFPVLGIIFFGLDTLGFRPFLFGRNASGPTAR